MSEYSSEKKIHLLKIQNSKNPEQMIDLLYDKSNTCFETVGLKDLFGVKEIRIESADFLQSLERYSKVLSFLFETMSTAEDLHLPYGYQNEFEFGDQKYTLHSEGEFMVLKDVAVQ